MKGSRGRKGELRRRRGVEEGGGGGREGEEGEEGSRGGGEEERRGGSGHISTHWPLHQLQTLYPTSHTLTESKTSHPHSIKPFSLLSCMLVHGKLTLTHILGCVSQNFMASSRVREEPLVIESLPRR